MTLYGPCRIAPLTLLIAMLLAVSGAMFADRVTASCGDYLHTSNSSDSAADHSDDSRPVCSGPHCSGGPLALTPPPTSAERNDIEVHCVASTRFDSRLVDAAYLPSPVSSEIYVSDWLEVLYRPPILAAF